MAVFISYYTFGNFWLTIQNTASRQMRNLFYLVAVFISFPLARAAAAAAVTADFRCCCCWTPPPHPAPFILEEGSSQKNKIACSVGDGVWTCLCRRGRGAGRGAVKASYERGVSKIETESMAVRPRTAWFLCFLLASSSSSFSFFESLSPSSQVS
jgi:hypothetical protein